MSNRPHIRPNGGQAAGVPLQVPPAPLPTQMIVQQAQVNGELFVVVTTVTPAGQGVVFLPVDMAKKVGQDILDRATPVTVMGLQPRGWQ